MLPADLQECGVDSSARETQALWGGRMLQVQLVLRRGGGGGGPPQIESSTIVAISFTIKGMCSMVAMYLREDGTRRLM